MYSFTTFSFENKGVVGGCVLAWLHHIGREGKKHPVCFIDITHKTPHHLCEPQAVQVSSCFFWWGQTGAFLFKIQHMS